METTITTLTIEIADETYAELKALADDAQISLDGFLNNLFIACLNDEDDDMPSNEEILESIRQGLIEALRGDVGRPLGEVLDEIREELKATLDIMTISDKKRTL